MEKHEAHALCTEHMSRYVRIQMVDGAIYDGFIEHVDDEHVYLAVPTRDGGLEDSRAFFPGFGGPFGFGHPFGFGGPFGFGHPFGFGGPFGFGHPFGFGFRRFGLPLGGLFGLSLLPFI